MNKNDISKIRIVFGYSFFGGICLSLHQFEMSIKFWVFNTHIDIFKFVGSLFASFKCKCEKKLHIVKHFAKSKKLFFCQYLSFSD